MNKAECLNMWGAFVYRRTFVVPDTLEGWEKNQIKGLIRLLEGNVAEKIETKEDVLLVNSVTDEVMIHIALEKGAFVLNLKSFINHFWPKEVQGKCTLPPVECPPSSKPQDVCDVRNRVTMIPPGRFDELPSAKARHSRVGRVYAVEYGSNVKIGFSGSLKARIRGFERQAKYHNSQIGLVAFTSPHSNFLQNEKIMHNLFEEYRVDGTELFNIPLWKAVDQLQLLTLEGEVEHEVKGNQDICQLRRATGDN